MCRRNTGKTETWNRKKKTKWQMLTLSSLINSPKSNWVKCGCARSRTSNPVKILDLNEVRRWCDSNSNSVKFSKRNEKRNVCVCAPAESANQNGIPNRDSCININKTAFKLRAKGIQSVIPNAICWTLMCQSTIIISSVFISSFTVFRHCCHHVLHSVHSVAVFHSEFAFVFVLSAFVKREKKNRNVSLSIRITATLTFQSTYLNKLTTATGQSRHRITIQVNKKWYAKIGSMVFQW